jgi:hypothetical protein
VKTYQQGLHSCAIVAQHGMFSTVAYAEIDKDRTENTIPLLLFPELLLSNGCCIGACFAVVAWKLVYMP